jgi:hypothetical protein
MDFNPERNTRQRTMDVANHDSYQVVQKSDEALVVVFTLYSL